jgi:hypothetical protein
VLSAPHPFVFLHVFFNSFLRGLLTKKIVRKDALAVQGITLMREELSFKNCRIRH